VTARRTFRDVFFVYSRSFCIFIPAEKRISHEKPASASAKKDIEN
jgi:hypothetical protein